MLSKNNAYYHSKDELLSFAGDYQELNSDLGMKILFEERHFNGKK